MLRLIISASMAALLVMGCKTPTHSEVKASIFINCSVWLALKFDKTDIILPYVRSGLTEQEIRRLLIYAINHDKNQTILALLNELDSIPFQGELSYALAAKIERSRDDLILSQLLDHPKVRDSRAVKQRILERKLNLSPQSLLDAINSPNIIAADVPPTLRRRICEEPMGPNLFRNLMEHHKIPQINDVQQKARLYFAAARSGDYSKLQYLLAHPSYGSSPEFFNQALLGALSVNQVEVFRSLLEEPALQEVSPTIRQIIAVDTEDSERLDIRQLLLSWDEAHHEQSVPAILEPHPEHGNIPSRITQQDIIIASRLMMRSPTKEGRIALLIEQMHITQAKAHKIYENIIDLEEYDPDIDY